MAGVISAGPFCLLCKISFLRKGRVYYLWRWSKNSLESGTSPKSDKTYMEWQSKVEKKSQRYLYTFRLSGKRITSRDRKSPFWPFWRVCGCSIEGQLQMGTYATCRPGLAACPLTIILRSHWNVCLSLPLPKLCSFAIYPQGAWRWHWFWEGWGKEEKGNEKAASVSWSHMTLPSGLPGFSSVSLPLGPWPLHSHKMDQRVPAFPDDWGPDC